MAAEVKTQEVKTQEPDNRPTAEVCLQACREAWSTDETKDEIRKVLDQICNAMLSQANAYRRGHVVVVSPSCPSPMGNHFDVVRTRLMDPIAAFVDSPPEGAADAPPQQHPIYGAKYLIERIRELGYHCDGYCYSSWVNGYAYQTISVYLPDLCPRVVPAICIDGKPLPYDCCYPQDATPSGATIDRHEC